MTSDAYVPSLKAVANQFRRFAAIECHNISPLYELFSLSIADDPELLGIAARARQGQPLPNLFFATIHFLLLRRPEYPLASFYPSISGNTARPAGHEAYRNLRLFCLKYRVEIDEIISTRMVQTNEVQRCSALLPSFCFIAQKVRNRPLALLDIGASAGLNLLWDHYGYNYGDELQYGNANSLVQIVCTLKGNNRPVITDNLPRVTFRLGLDLNPIDVYDFASTLWLRALVWPDEGNRDAILQKAIQIAQLSPPRLIAGDAIDILPDILNQIPNNAILCVFDTYMITHLPQSKRNYLSCLLDQHATKRDFFRVSIDLPHESPCSELKIVAFEHGASKEKLLAHCDTHGKWLEWLYTD